MKFLMHQNTANINVCLYDITIFTTSFVQIVIDPDFTSKVCSACYKVFKADILRKEIKLNATGFDFDQEVTAKVLKKGHRILEVGPIYYHPRTWDEGKKVNWKTGLLALWTLVKYRLT